LPPKSSPRVSDPLWPIVVPLMPAVMPPVFAVVVFAVALALEF
jgi:hypothetical protein